MSGKAKRSTFEQLLVAAQDVCDIYDVDPDVQEVGGEPLEAAMEVLLEACVPGLHMPDSHRGMISVVFCILECVRYQNGKDTRDRALMTLRESTINGHEVLAVIKQERIAKPMLAPHFGYNHGCLINGCDHMELSFGANRYFDAVLILKGSWDLRDTRRYWIDGCAQITVVGKKGVYDGERHALEPAE